MYKYICYVGREIVVDTPVGLPDNEIEELAKAKFLVSLLDNNDDTPLLVEITDEIRVCNPYTPNPDMDEE